MAPAGEYSKQQGARKVRFDVEKQKWGMAPAEEHSKQPAARYVRFEVEKQKWGMVSAEEHSKQPAARYGRITISNKRNRETISVISACSTKPRWKSLHRGNFPYECVDHVGRGRRQSNDSATSAARYTHPTSLREPRSSPELSVSAQFMYAPAVEHSPVIEKTSQLETVTSQVKYLWYRLFRNRIRPRENAQPFDTIGPLQRVLMNSNVTCGRDEVLLKWTRVAPSCQMWTSS
ncbi:hypothetical protein J6590_063044 [Homalodisca vitripennis]|nr:hypothetical protein J6590_063044 [Homalodisca vitripennis]